MDAVVADDQAVDERKNRRQITRHIRITAQFIYE